MALSRPRRPSPPPPALMLDELVEEILLRLPPDEPAYLVHAALVCKPWRRILSDAGFRRRYIELHRSPPLLGYIHTNLTTCSPRFISTSTMASLPFSPLTTINSWRVLDCRHGRVLIKNYDQLGLIVWDPTTGHQHHLNMINYVYRYFEIGAVLCAVDGCDHLDCHGGPFRVVSVGMDVDAGPYGTEDGVVRVTLYSSETCEWSNRSYINIHPYNLEVQRPSLLIGDALYFPLEYGFSVLKYDLNTHALSIVDSPPVFGAVVTTAEDGGLGFISMLGDSIYTWSLLCATAEIGIEWEKAQQFVMELGTLLPSDPYRPRL
ncbi:hypothetical protein QOZ80_7BG0585010 [Eleusine coracana subsp. coracana]|nr:hypothetical protein QOZ80_7BG0585010 [Eleusine coracana subsp. coracana]